MRDPTRSPAWAEQTVFLATRGVTSYGMNYCHASDMVMTRVGFVLSSFVTVSNISYQGLDTIRPGDNGALCGGGAFETKGCAENDCSRSQVNNGGSDGMGSVNVTIDNVRINDYFFLEDARKIGAHVPGNYNCSHQGDPTACCFCKPNGVRASQVGVWVPQTRNAAGTRNLLVSNLVSSATQADGINLHGSVTGARVTSSFIRNTGDDSYALWGANLNPSKVEFADCVAVNPGVVRPGWYGNCVATYGLRSVVFRNITCKAPTLLAPLPNNRPCTSMFVVYTSFGGVYPRGNRLEIDGWTFLDLEGRPYTPGAGVVYNGTLVPGKMEWTRPDIGKGKGLTPYYLPSRQQQVNVYVDSPGEDSTVGL